MKSEDILKNLRSFFAEYVIFFALGGFMVTVSFLSFFHYVDWTEEQIREAAPYTFANIVFLTAVFVLIDVTRRTFMIHRPVKQIQSALDEITSGDFSVRLDPNGSKEFSEIMKSINHMTAEL